MVIVAVEMLSGGAGIGFFVWDSYNTSNLAAVAAAIVATVAVDDCGERIDAERRPWWPAFAAPPPP